MAGYDSTVRLWDLASGAELAHYDWPVEQENKLLFDAQFMPDGRSLVAAGQSGTRVIEICDSGADPRSGTAEIER